MKRTVARRRILGPRGTAFSLVPLAVVTLCLAACPPNAVLSNLETAADIFRNGAVAAPQIGPSSGSYSFDLTGAYALSVSDSTSDATIHYTITSGTQGVTPTASSPTYSGPIAIAGDNTVWTVEAVAQKDGWQDSTVVSANYQINHSKLSTPTFSSPGGTFSAAQSLTVNVPNSGESGITVYYTVASNGAIPPDPTTSVNDGNGPNPLTLPLSGTGTRWIVKAMATASDKANSDTVTSGTFSLGYPPGVQPTFATSPSSPPFYAQVSVTITSASTSNGAVIRYTTDGTTPSASNGATYSSPVTVSTSGTTLKAVATGGPYSDSTVQSAIYTVITQVPSPQISPGTNTYVGSQTVTITDVMPGAVFYYTTDGSTPTHSSTQYTGSFSVGGVLSTITVKAIATYPGMTDSAVMQVSYTFVL